MDSSILFHGNLMKYDVISNSHKEEEEKILNRIKEKKLNYLKLSEGFSNAYKAKIDSCRKKTN